MTSAPFTASTDVDIHTDLTNVDVGVRLCCDESRSARDIGVSSS